MKKNEDQYVEIFISLSNYVERCIKVSLILLFALCIVAQFILQTDKRTIISPLDRLEGIPYTDESTVRDMLIKQLQS